MPPSRWLRFDAPSIATRVRIFTRAIVRATAAAVGGRMMRRHAALKAARNELPRSG